MKISSQVGCLMGQIHNGCQSRKSFYKKQILLLLLCIFRLLLLLLASFTGFLARCRVLSCLFFSFFFFFFYIIPSFSLRLLLLLLLHAHPSVPPPVHPLCLSLTMKNATPKRMEERGRRDPFKRRPSLS